MSTYSEYLDFLGHADNESRQQIDNQIEKLHAEIKSQKTLLAKIQRERDGFSADLSKANKTIGEKIDELNIKAVEIDSLKKEQQQKDDDHQKQLDKIKKEAAKKLSDECTRLQKQHDEATEKLVDDHNKREEELKEQIETLTQEKGQLEGVFNQLSTNYVKKEEYQALKELYDNTLPERHLITIKSFGYGAASICLLWFFVSLISRCSSEEPLREVTEEPIQRITYVIDTLMNGKKVTGYFEDSVLFYGTMMMENGAIYTGHFAESLPSGVGMETYADRRYFGQYANGKKDGYGILVSKDENMAGRFKNDGFVEDLQKTGPEYQDLMKARQAYNDRDYKRAFELYTKTNVRTLMVAEDFFRMGYMVNTGNGTVKDPNVAACWYWVAAEQGHTLAMSNLGSLLYSGGALQVNGKWNAPMAFYWLRRSVDSGKADENTKYRLGKCYENGWGTSINIPKAISLYEQAQNISDAKSRLENLKKVMNDKSR